MNRNDLLGVFNEIVQFRHGCAGNTVIQFHSGKVFYLGKGGLLHIENDTTHAFPDAAIGYANFEFLYNWVCHQSRDDLIMFGVSRGDLIIRCKDNVMAFPVAKNVASAYEGIEEAVLRPVLTHKYELQIPYDEWVRAIGLLLSAHFDGTTNATVDIRISYEGVLVETVNSSVNVRGRGAIKIEGYPAGHNAWQNRYFLSPLCLDPGISPNNDHELVTVSFTDNESKQLSAFMVRYPNGFSVVAQPLWT